MGLPPPPPPPPMPYKRGLSKSAKVAIAVVLIVVIITASFIALYQGQLRSSLSGSDSQNPFFPTIIYEPKLDIAIYEQNGIWSRSYSDLPELEKSFGISLINTGNSAAQEITVTIKEDWSVINQYSIAALQPSESNSYSYTIHINYDASKTVTVEAVCSQCSDQDSMSFTATLPRRFDEVLCKLYITPNEQSVVNLKNQILDDKFLLTPNWMALRDWVGDNIQYRYDSNSNGQNDHWQLPKETISRRTGDCEDFSILLCSLLRADGWSTNSAYVVVGEKDGSYHAWVRIIWSGIQYNIEPQADGWATLLGDFLSLSGYSAEHKFNDFQFGSA